MKRADSLSGSEIRGWFWHILAGNDSCVQYMYCHILFIGQSVAILSHKLCVNDDVGGNIRIYIYTDNP